MRDGDGVGGARDDDGESSDDMDAVIVDDIVAVREADTVAERVTVVSIARAYPRAAATASRAEGAIDMPSAMLDATPTIRLIIIARREIAPATASEGSLGGTSAADSAAGTAS